MVPQNPEQRSVGINIYLSLSPIDIQIQGNDLFVAQEIARKIRDNIKSIEGARDIRIMQRLNQPFLDIRVDREKAAEMGVNAVEATKNLVSALNSSTSFEKAFWIDERNGNHYFVGRGSPSALAPTPSATGLPSL